jgi:hypothetical protein
MSRTVMGLLAALVASVGLNAYLALARDGGSSAREVSVEAGFSRTEAAPAASDVPTVRARAETDPAQCPTALADCRADLSSLDECTSSLPLHKRFPIGQRNADGEARIAAVLPKVFADPAPATDLECRDDVCRVDIVWTEGQDQEEYIQRFQDPELWGDLVGGRSFHSGRPGVDPISGEAVFSESIYLELRTAGTVNGMKILEELVGAFMASDARAVCAARHGDRGRLELRIDIGEDGDGGITIAAGGDLAGKPGGKCLVDRLEAMAAETPVPARVSGAVRFVGVVME